MKKNGLKILAVLTGIIAIVFTLGCMSAFADNVATDITSEASIDTDGFTASENLTNGYVGSGATCGSDGGIIYISHKENIGGVYIKFNSEPGTWTMVCGENSYTYGGKGFLHEYVDVSENNGESKNLVLVFSGKFDISELYVLSEGERPDWVQDWQQPLKEADLLLFSTHSDDDQLFFAGLIPYYVAKNYRVQVAYFTNHPDAVERRHEFLDGMWVAGAVNYPIYGEFDDFRIDDLQDTIDEYKDRGTSYEQMEGFVVKTIRQTKPLVTVTHDINGEYGHGMHLLLSKLVRDAIEICPDAEKYANSAKTYGTWTVQKTYIHLYSEDKIVLPIDQPLARFGGKTAFQVSQDAFQMHKSQHWTWFYGWLYGKDGVNITKSSEIATYNPGYYGLYDSKVGEDIEKNDMFENIISYGEMEEAEKHEAELKELREQLSSALSKIDELTSTVNELTKGSEDNKALIEEKEKEIDRLKKQCNLLISKLSEYENVTIEPEQTVTDHTQASPTGDSESDMDKQLMEDARRLEKKVTEKEKIITLCMGALVAVVVISIIVIAFFVGRYRFLLHKIS